MSDDALHAWTATVCAATDLDPAVVDIGAVLDLAKDAAHGVARPAAPLTTYLAGVLVGRRLAAAGDPDDPGGLARRVLDDVAALVPAPAANDVSAAGRGEPPTRFPSPPDRSGASPAG